MQNQYIPIAIQEMTYKEYSRFYNWLLDGSGYCFFDLTPRQLEDAVEQFHAEEAEQDATIIRKEVKA